jgi:hypothetical protein
MFKNTRDFAPCFEGTKWTPDSALAQEVCLAAPEADATNQRRLPNVRKYHADIERV